MTGLDTNVLLRFILNDDPVHTPKARALLNGLTSQKPGWISAANVLEIAWVLSETKQIDRKTVSRTIEDLVILDTVVVEHASAVLWAAQRFAATKADFADCLIAAIARAVGCERTMTFDRIAARDAGMELIA